MKMAVCLQRNKCLFLALALLLLSACGSGDGEDLTPPELTLNAVHPSTFEKEKTISGAIGDAAEIEVTVDTAAVVGPVSVANGTWSCLISALAVGANNVTVSASDARGNSNVLQFVLTYEVLRLDQVATTTFETTPAFYGSMVPGGNITQVALNGTALVLPVSIDGTRWNFSLSPYQGLIAGSNTVTITAEDSPINPQRQDVVLAIVWDGSAIPLTIDPPQTPTDQNNLVLTGTVGLGGVVSVVADTNAAVSAVTYPTATSWTVAVSGLEERENILTVSATRTGTASAATWTRVTVYSIPMVTATLPPAGAGGVLTDAALTVLFSEVVIASTVNSATFRLEDSSGIPVSGEVSYEAGDKSATFIPAFPLISGVSYSAVIDGVSDPDGNPVASYRWHFETL